MTTQEKVDFINNEFIPMLQKANSVLKPDAIEGITEESMAKVGDIVSWFPNANLVFLVRALEAQIFNNISDIV